MLLIESIDIIGNKSSNLRKIKCSFKKKFTMYQTKTEFKMFTLILKKYQD